MSKIEVCNISKIYPWKFMNLDFLKVFFLFDLAAEMAFCVSKGFVSSASWKI